MWPQYWCNYITHSSWIKGDDPNSPCRFAINSSKLDLNTLVFNANSNIKSTFKKMGNILQCFNHCDMTIIFHLFICRGLVRFCALYQIKPHVPSLVYVPLNSFKFQACGPYIFQLCSVPPNRSLIRKDYHLENTLL